MSAATPMVRLRLWRSTTGRFVLLQLLLSLACTLPILLYVYVQFDRLLVADFSRPLEFRQSNLEKQYRLYGLDGLRIAVTSRAERAHRDQTAVLLVDALGRKLAGNIASWPDGVEAPQDWTPALLQRREDPAPTEFLVRTSILPSGHRLLLGGLLDNRADLHRSLLLALLAAFTLAVPVGLLGSFVLVREINRMVVAITAVGDQVGAGELHKRAIIDGSGDAVDRLKVSLNGTLDRVEALVAEHRVLTDALAHDLRSPLTRIHIQVMEGLSGVSDDTSKARYDAIAQEIEYVLHILDGALEISRAEAGIGRASFESVDIGAMLRDLGEIYQPLAATAGVAISVRSTPKLCTNGNRALLARALSNLVDNALKYGAGGGTIELEASARHGDVEVCVADRASGIPPERRSDAIRKFGRLDPARSTPGSGLGLTLVQAVASLHGGSLGLEDNRPGLRACLVLPLLTSNPSSNE